MNRVPSSAACPTPIDQSAEVVTLAHGEGGLAMRRLIQKRILSQLNIPNSLVGNDAAVLAAPNGELAFTTDSFVVTPLFFPGGDIGRLAVYGTVNDLAVAGARPLWMSLAFVLEEGLPLSTLDRILQSIAAAANSIGIQVVTGDTKVVPRGAADQIFINTSGVGQIVEPAPAGPASLEDGDAIIVSGPIGQHGAAILVAREGMECDPPPESDCGSVIGAANALRTSGIQVKAMRDATRGGVAAVLHEWSESCGQSIVLEESAAPVSDNVRGLLELLGLDPLHMANEGTMVAAVPQTQAGAAVAALRSTPPHEEAAVVGRVQSRTSCPVSVRRGLGVEIPLDEPLGALLPRIC